MSKLVVDMDTIDNKEISKTVVSEIKRFIEAMNYKVEWDKQNNNLSILNSKGIPFNIKTKESTVDESVYNDIIKHYTIEHNALDESSVEALTKVFDFRFLDYGDEAILRFESNKKFRFGCRPLVEDNTSYIDHFMKKLEIILTTRDNEYKNINNIDNLEGYYNIILCKDDAESVAQDNGIVTAIAWGNYFYKIGHRRGNSTISFYYSSCISKSILVKRGDTDMRPPIAFGALRKNDEIVATDIIFWEDAEIHIVTI